jgi:hypothetical protein
MLSVLPVFRGGPRRSLNMLFGGQQHSRQQKPVGRLHRFQYVPQNQLGVLHYAQLLRVTAESQVSENFAQHGKLCAFFMVNPPLRRVRHTVLRDTDTPHFASKSNRSSSRYRSGVLDIVVNKCYEIMSDQEIFSQEIPTHLNIIVAECPSWVMLGS